ncbi:Fic/DOC family protein [Filimonas lacunae]|uniref:Fic/DOC family protein n=1 Tax=Filimonas lacunae TaxID=477680 RepID=A0A173MPC7_9BACT|nr:virulence protein RhuM/Fic/DOC family protein [Filimonas lacunae]BAV09535.1 DNA-binding protein in cluster with Type I restriction-modification system [Filimonas lacunae]SIS74832.1 Fic/DOC family protein [Filimonas lacunae]
MENGSILIYQSSDGQTAIDVTLENDTLWLTQKQIAELFGTQRPAITKHLNNLFKTNEIEENSVRSILEHTATDGKKYETKYYNLDAVLSVGYRVNSKNATRFRIWTNKVLKEYLVKGYSLNEKRLQETAQQFNALQQTVRLLSNVLEPNALSSDEASGLIKVLTDYTYALDVLDKYDHRSLTVEATHKQSSFIATYDEAMKAIHSLKDKFGGSSLFGNEKDESFKSSIATIYQSFAGVDLYPSIEEKAAHLLYFVVKNHSFSDGNKRIAAFLFVWFLEKNGLLYRNDGTKRIADNALVALTLMIAESKPDEKDIMAQVVVNLINGYN